VAPAGARCLSGDEALTEEVSSSDVERFIVAVPPDPGWTGWSYRGDAREQIDRSLVALGAAVLLAVGGWHSRDGYRHSLPAPASTHRHLVEAPAQQPWQGLWRPSECAGTLLDTYIDQLFADLTEEQFAFLVAHQDTLFNVPTYDALFFGTPNDPDYALEATLNRSGTPSATCVGSGTSSPRHPVDGHAR
jgi:hypothetical protein